MEMCFADALVVYSCTLLEHHTMKNYDKVTSDALLYPRQRPEF